MKRRRSGKVMILTAILAPAMLATLMLVLDGSQVVSKSRDAQHVADTAALSAADEYYFTRSYATAIETARDSAAANLADPSSRVEVHAPPIYGPYAHSPHHIEVIIRREANHYFGLNADRNDKTDVVCRAVAGLRPSTDNAAIVILDPDPPPFLLGNIVPVVPSLPALVGGFEVLGLGRTQVDGAVLVNTRWGGLDEHGGQVGDPHLLKWSIACMPVLPLTKLRASDIRTVGGVDRLENYGNFGEGSGSVLQANRRPVPDPFLDMPVPTVSADAVNVDATLRGGRTIIGLPLIGPATHLYPGVYEWIDVVSGRVVFHPGVYIIRNKNPLTQISLSVLAGQVEAEGVMFYITNNSSYSANSGSPDNQDHVTHPGSQGPLENVVGLLPSVVVNVGLLGSHFSPLDSPGSPFDGMMFYQRRNDRRPIVIVQENLLGSGSLGGSVYSKWGHVILAGKGEYDARFVVGTMRIIALLDVMIRPSAKLPPAYDVYLVE